MRLTAQNARGLTGGNGRGIFCNQANTTCYDDSWRSLSDTIEGWLQSAGWSDPESLFPLLLVVWAFVLVATVALHFVQRSPWARPAGDSGGRGRSLLALASRCVAPISSSRSPLRPPSAALAGFFLAMNRHRPSHPADFDPTFTFFGYAVLVLGGLANYWGVAVGTHPVHVDLPRRHPVFLDLPHFQASEQAALRLIIVGVFLLISLISRLRPQGMSR